MSTVLYFAVAAALTGVVKYTELSNQSAPVAYALTRIGQNWMAGLLSLGAMAGITSVLLVMMLGQTKIFFAMSRDGLLPKVFGEVSPKTKTPIKSTLLTLVLTGITSAFLPINIVAELTNIGALAAFIIVSIGIIILRIKKPDVHRPFRCPGVPLIPTLAVALSIYLIASLDPLTWIRFFMWLFIGIILYFLYSKKHSTLQDKKP